MDAKTWEALRGAIVETHTEMLREGIVTPPTLYALRNWQLLGYVSLRQVRRGRDAIDAVAELGQFAAGGEADEVVLVWESQDLAVATELPPDHPEPCLTIAHARDDRCRLHRLPYRERPIGTAAGTGLAAAAPQWLNAPAHEDGALLPPPIQLAIDMSFAPWDPPGSNPGLEAAGLYLEQLGYRVRYARPRDS